MAKRDKTKATEVTAAELADLLGTSITLVNRWRRLGKLYRPNHLGSVVAKESRLPHQPRMYWSDTRTSADRRKPAPEAKETT